MNSVLASLLFVSITSALGLGLDDPFRSGCVFNVVGETDDGDAEFDGEGNDVLTVRGNISSDVIQNRDCVVVFRDLPKGKLRCRSY